MNKNLISISVLILCVACLFVGIYSASINRFKLEELNKAHTTKGKIISTDMKIALIDLAGVIETSSKSDIFSNDYSASSVLKSLRGVINDKDIKGVILRINSPGGTVGMSQSIYDEVIRLRKIKPVLILIEDIAASGGYYIACAGDRIIAHEGSLTGSIGVIMSTMDLHKLMNEKLLINNNVIKSGKYKDIGSNSREMTGEERALLQDIVNDSYQQFISAIINGRVARQDKYSAEKTDLTEKTLRSLADGRIFTGKKAKAYGFVDALGGINEAEKMMQSMVNDRYKTHKKVKIVTYSKRTTLNEYLFGVTESIFDKNLQMSNMLPVSMRLTKRPLYLWE